jgi:hypothetical protein
MHAHAWRTVMIQAFHLREYPVTSCGPPAQVISLCLLLTISVSANSAEATREFYALSDLTYDRSAKTVLINAVVANPKEFPSIFYSFTSGGPCTSTLVGVRVLMTAAHCVSDGEKVTIAKGKESFSGPCQQAKGYSTNPSADWALCALDGEPAGIIHETINSNNNLVKKGQVILLSGFGCITSDGSGGKDGVYRVGASTVAILPAGDNNDLQTLGGAALCYGDSGGPAFVVSPEAIVDPGRANVLAKRLLISVNSRGNLRDVSVLVSMSTPAAQSFIQDWTHGPGAGLKICGLSPAADMCRALP